jgi:phosphatidylserine/phosphatidylglycerophosphate/cardiolipin synthase-like enzyme
MKYKALKYRYQAEVATAKAELSNYFENSVGVGDHPNIIDSMDELVGQLAQAEEKLTAIEYFVRYESDIE